MLESACMHCCSASFRGRIAVSTVARRSRPAPWRCIQASATREQRACQCLQPNTCCKEQDKQQLLQQLQCTSGAALLSALVVLSSLGQPAVAHARESKPREELTGAARIVDGDTLWLESAADGTRTKIRLFGLDAPEKKQSCADALGRGYPCGQEALTALQQHVGNKPVHCVVRNKDQYGRAVATCGIQASPGLEEDVGAWMVANGHAVAYRQYSKGYVALEEQAHEQGKGVWQGQFTMPNEWRKAQRNHQQDVVS